MPVVVDELHHRVKSKRFWEAVLSSTVKNLDQFVISSFPGINSARLWSHFVSLLPIPSKWCKSKQTTDQHIHIAFFYQTNKTVRLQVRSPEGQSVFSLNFAGGIPHQEGTIGSVSHFVIHLLSTTHIKPLITDPTFASFEVITVVMVYLEMSPQYHSASLSKLLFPLVTDEAMALALGGLGGRAE